VFLRTLLRRRKRNKKMVLIVDNASYHKSADLNEFLRGHADVLRLLYLPPYSPDLNPIERVWKLTRRLCTHNRYFPDLDSLRAVVANQLRAWSKPNDTLRRLCCIN
jgi:transposase